jgi:peptidoglycan/LPS O-acetylase OafA/YrhL
VETTNKALPKHVSYLDSARGIAAIMVMAYHFINWNFEKTLNAKLASIVFNGSDAVSFFFVLSGFVLSYKYIVLNEALDIRKFYVARLLRLWPAFSIVVLLTTLNNMREHFNAFHFKEVFISNSKFWQEAILLRTRSNLFGPGWTLYIELVLSLFIPFEIMIAKAGNKYLLWLLFAYLLMKDEFHIHFVLGVGVSCLFRHVQTEEFRQTNWYKLRYVILAAAVLLFSIRHITRISPMGPDYTYWADYIGITFFHYTALASFLFLLAIIMSRRTQQILNHRLLLFLGKISYGIYLTHWMLVSDVFYYWKPLTAYFGNETNAFAIMSVLYVASTIVLATLLHYAVELPFIRLAKRITGRMEPSVVIK